MFSPLLLYKGEYKMKKIYKEIIGNGLDQIESIVDTSLNTFEFTYDDVYKDSVKKDKLEKLKMCMEEIQDLCTPILHVIEQIEKGN
jgi:hypothetical protein